MISKLNYVFCLTAAFSLCLKSSLAGTLKSTPNTLINDPVDIQSEIQYTAVLNFLRKSSNATNLEDLIKPYSFRSLDFKCRDWNNVDSILAVLRLLNLPESSAIRANVHEIKISGLNSQFSAAILPRVENIIPQLENLAVLRWENCPQLITPSILKAIESRNPPAKLYYSLPYDAQDYRSEDEQDFEQTKLIPGSPSLHYLRADNKYNQYSNEKTLGHVFNALVSSPNINELHLSFPKEKPYDGPNAFDFSARVGERFYPLQVLRLEGYNFDSKSIGRCDEASEENQYQWNDGTDDVRATELRRRLDQQLLPTKKTTARSNMEWWLEAMDWSQIHTLDLKLTSLKTLHLLSGAVPKLSKLSLQSRKFEDAAVIVDFIANIPPLEFLELLDLRLDNFDNLLNVIISEKHNQSLKHLSLTARNHLDSSVVLRLNSTTIHRLLHSLPQLESLSLAIFPTEKEWDYQLLQNLVLNHKIRHLTLHVNTEDDNNDMFYSPLSSFSLSQSLINATSIPGLFRYMRKHKTGVPLDTLTVRINQRHARNTPGRQFATSYIREDDSDNYFTTNIAYKCSLDSIGLEVCENSHEMGHGLFSDTSAYFDD